MIVIDGTNKPLGRLASFAAKKALEGETVIILNAEKVIISGNRRDVFARWKRRVDLRSLGNPRIHTPKYPRTVVGIVKRAVRGMLPHRTKRGKAAYSRVRVYRGVPEEFKNAPLTDLPFRLPRKYVTVGELAAWLGGK